MYPGALARTCGVLVPELERGMSSGTVRMVVLDIVVVGVVEIDDDDDDDEGGGKEGKRRSSIYIELANEETS